MDPAQTRTIGVVTKIDTIQNDSDTLQKLRAERVSDIKLTPQAEMGGSAMPYAN